MGHAGPPRPRHPHPRRASLFPCSHALPHPLIAKHVTPSRLQTKSIKYLDENFASRDVVLSAEELQAVRDAIEQNPVKGAQYGPALAAMLDE